MSNQKGITLLACFIASLLGGCKEEEPQFDYADLPEARQGWSVSGSVGVLLEYSNVKGYFMIGNETFQDQSKAVDSVVKTLVKLKTEKRRHRVLFRFPKDFPANDFATICRRVRSLTKKQTRFNLLVKPPVESRRHESQVSEFILGDIATSLDSDNESRELDTVRIRITADDFLIDGKRVRVVSTVQEHLEVLVQAAELTSSTPEIEIRIEDGVKLQRLISTLDFDQVQDLRISFPESD